MPRAPLLNLICCLGIFFFETAFLSNRWVKLYEGKAYSRLFSVASDLSGCHGDMNKRNLHLYLAVRVMEVVLNPAR